MNKILLTFILVLNIFFTVQCQEQKMFTLKVEVSGMKSNKGSLFLAVYKGEKRFLKKAFKSDILKIYDKSALAIIKGLEKGEYAVTVFHDENDNKKMDVNIFGVPKEDYGCSNGATGFMGPPKYKRAKFDLKNNMTIKIKVN